MPKAEEKPNILSLRDLLGLLPIINIVLAIIFILLIPNFFVDVVLFFMLLLTIAFFLSMIIEVFAQLRELKQNDYTENSLLINNSMNVSPLVLYAGQFF